MCSTEPPSRRVVILQDRGSATPLWFLQCATPCNGSKGGCMDMGDRTGCYLGGSLSEAGAREMATRCGYEVVA